MTDEPSNLETFRQNRFDKMPGIANCDVAVENEEQQVDKERVTVPDLEYERENRDDVELLPDLLIRFRQQLIIKLCNVNYRWDGIR